MKTSIFVWQRSYAESARRGAQHSGPVIGVLFFANKSKVRVDVRDSVSVSNALRKMGKQEVVGEAWKSTQKGRGWSFTSDAAMHRYFTSSSLESGEKKMWLEIGRKRRHTERMEKDPEYALNRYLSCHDWWYDYSDDPSVWNAGWAAWTRIRELIEKVPKATAIKLWKKYAPKEFGKCPFKGEDRSIKMS